MVTLPLLVSNEGITFRRDVRTLHQIEITSNCNLRCVYCPSPHLPRPKLDMSLDHFEAALDLVRYFVRKGTQGELNLAGIGESTMHPNFVEWVHKARAALGDDQRLVFATNGLLFTPEMANAIKDAKPSVFVSLHRPEKAKFAVEAAKAAGILVGISIDPAMASVNWAGQVDWPQTASPSECDWMKSGWVFVMADGRLSHCCFDASGIGVFGKIEDFVVDGKINYEAEKSKSILNSLHPSKLCRTCYLKIPVFGFNQDKSHVPNDAGSTSSV